MTKKPFLSLPGLVILCVAVVSGFIFFLNTERERPPHDSNISKKFANLYVFEGTFTHFVKGKRVFTFEAEEVVHRKRKVGPLTINPIKELELTNVRIELHDMDYLNTLKKFDSNTHDTMMDPQAIRLPLGQIFKKTFGDMQLGFVSRIIIRGITLEANQAGKGLFKLFAKKAEFKMRSMNVIFEEGFSLTGKNGQRLVTLRAEWKDKKAAFFIPGLFVFKTGQQEHASSNAYFSLQASGEIRQKTRENHN